MPTILKMQMLSSLYILLQLDIFLFHILPICSLTCFLNNSDLVNDGIAMLDHFALTGPVQNRFQGMSLVFRSLNPDTSDLS